MREAVKGDDLASMQRGERRLQKASHAIAEQLYKQSQANAANAAAPPQAQHRRREGRRSRRVECITGAGCSRPKSEPWLTRVTRLMQPASKEQTNHGYSAPFYLRDEDVTAARQLGPAGGHLRDREHDLVVKAELPDMSREDIEVTVENSTLTLHGHEEAARAA